MRPITSRRDPNWKPTTSYQENRFYFFWTREVPDITLVRQLPIGIFFADFAHIPSRTVIEIDGHEFHSKPEDIAYDKYRQGQIEKLGWKVIRFTGRQTNREPVRCVYQTHSFIRSRMASGDFRAEPPTP